MSTGFAIANLPRHRANPLFQSFKGPSAGNGRQVTATCSQVLGDRFGNDSGPWKKGRDSKLAEKAVCPLGPGCPPRPRAKPFKCVRYAKRIIAQPFSTADDVRPTTTQPRVDGHGVPDLPDNTGSCPDKSGEVRTNPEKSGGRRAKR
jgi:hypothetical protein